MSGYHIGCCITAHGLGHAARTLAVMEALARLTPVRFTVVSTVPGWFFAGSDLLSIARYELLTDIGLIQHSPLHEDIAATINALKQFYPLRQKNRIVLANLFADCDLVLCDIAPAGIVAAAEAGIPSVLLENFTWDWIYQGYCSQYPELTPFIRDLQELFARADYRIQASPVCQPGDADLTVGPIAREFRRSRQATRHLLHLDEAARVVLVSMGGAGDSRVRLREPDDGETVFLVPGEIEQSRKSAQGGIVFADRNMHHPDLVAASDAVIGKVGYSTLAEVYHAGTAFGYLPRSQFRESGPLTAFIGQEMAGVEIAEQDLATGRLDRYLPALFTAEVPEPRYENGAGRCAQFLLDLLAQKV